MKDQVKTERDWIKGGAICGLTACIIYPLLILVDMPQLLTIALVAAFGPLLSIGGVGLYHLLKLHRKTVTGQIAAGAVVVAGAMVNMMLIVQLAVQLAVGQYRAGESDPVVLEMLKWIHRVVDKVQLGMDISWDVYISIATFLFGLNMLGHPRFGKIFGGLGITVALLLIGFNLYTFPTPPANAGLIDFGPLVGLWYALASVLALRSLKWVDEQAGM